MLDLLVGGGEVHTPTGILQADLVIDQGVIWAVVPRGEAPPTREVIDAEGMSVLPGLIDPHVHFNEPGRTSWEGWSSGSLAAAAGGITTVVDMPIDSHPPTISAAAVLDKVEIASRKSLVDFALWGGLIPGNLGHLSEMADVGVAGFKAFRCESGWEEFPPVDEVTFREGLKQSRALSLVVALHCEDQATIDRNGGVRTTESEVEAVRWAGRIASEVSGALHVVHISSVDAVTEARRWPNVTTETCPHYLVFDEVEAKAIGAPAVCNPPIRDFANRGRLWDALLGGEISCLASDHSPCSPSLKMADPPFSGISGIQTGLSVLLAQNKLGLRELVVLMTRAAKILNLGGKGEITAGYDADLVLFDPYETWTLNESDLHTRHQISPFIGQGLKGRVIRTIVRGKTVFLDGEGVTGHLGRFITPNRR